MIPAELRCEQTGKKRYATQLGADAEVRALQCTTHELWQLASLLKSYPCDHCGDWHVGHDRRARRYYWEHPIGLP